MSAFAGGELALEVEGAIATVEIRREPARNAATAAIWAALPDLCAAIEADPAIRVVLLRGQGERAFCAGADIAEFPRVYATPQAACAYNDAMRVGQAALAALERPSIAVIHGACMGAGMGLALSCDLRFAATGAKFCVPPARLGAVYPYPDVKRLVDLIGPARAKDMLFSARVVAADTALGWGLIDRLSDAPEADALVYAQGLGQLSAGSIRAAKRMVAAACAGEAQETPALRALAEDAFAGADFREGYAAFMEKRAPVFE